LEEKNEGDIFTGAGCAGQRYVSKLPNNAIQVAGHFYVLVNLKRITKKRVPDYEVYNTITDLKNGKNNI
jgi:hypothetical protein